MRKPKLGKLTREWGALLSEWKGVRCDWAAATLRAHKNKVVQVQKILETTELSSDFDCCKQTKNSFTFTHIHNVGLGRDCMAVYQPTVLFL